MNLLDNFYRKRVGATNENLKFDRRKVGGFSYFKVVGKAFERNNGCLNKSKGMCCLLC